MKKKTILCAVCLMALLLAFGFVLTGCGSSSDSGTAIEADADGTGDGGAETGEGDEGAENIDPADADAGTDSVAAPTLLYMGHASLRIVTGGEAAADAEATTGSAEDSEAAEDAGATDAGATTGAAEDSEAAGSKVIYIDPYAGDGYDLPADLILVTHCHYDHSATDLIEKRNDDCQVITQNEALQNKTFDLGYVQVEAVQAGNNKNHSIDECVGYVLTFENGTKLYVSGDTSKTDQMAELADQHIDYAFFCCDGIYNMDLDEAAECAGLVQAKHNIPYHMVDAENPDHFDLERAEQFDAPGKLILKPGEELTLE